MELTPAIALYEVMTAEEAYTLLGKSRQNFHQNYLKKLTSRRAGDRTILVLRSEVVALQRRLIEQEAAKQAAQSGE